MSSSRRFAAGFRNEKCIRDSKRGGLKVKDLGLLTMLKTSEVLIDQKIGQKIKSRLFVDAPILFRGRILSLAFAATHPPDPSMKAKPVQNECQAYDRYEGQAAIDSNLK
jgi:hypothetical protein